MRLKLDDIGRLAGVSRSTVSRVVNGERNVRPEVRKRVEDVIRETGYTPNAAARSLVSNRTGVIGLVIPGRVLSLFEDPYFPRLIQGISHGTNQAGVTLSLFLFHTEDEERELYPRVVESGFVDGVIITATRTGDPLVERAASSGMPVVMVGRPDVEGISHVDVDNRAGGVMAANHLVDIGAERIGMIAAPANTTAGLDRLAGFTAGLAERGRTLDPELVAGGSFSESSGHAAMSRLLDRGVDAVFAASDAMAVGALDAARDRGLDVPGDVAVMGFDGFEASERNRLTTIRQPVAENARESVSMLLALISGATRSPASTVLPVELVARETTRTDHLVSGAASP